MDSRIKYKVDKYVSKLKNAQTPEEANMYQAKLRFYHRKNQIGSGADEQKQKEASISELLGALKDRIERCDKALEKLDNIDSRMSKIEEQLAINRATGDKTGNPQKIMEHIVTRIKELAEDIKKLKENKSSQNSNQGGGSNDIVLDMSSDAGEEFSNSMFGLFN